jgi:hypothetical protein
LRVDDAWFLEPVPAVTTKLHFWLPFQIIVRPLKQIATLGAGASRVQARVLDIVAVLSRPFPCLGGSATRAIGATGLLRKPFSPETILIGRIIAAPRRKKP